jgi:type IV pilus assembly protein PilC
MLPFFLFLGIPVLGALVVVAEHFRRNGETPRVRTAGRMALLVLGGLLGLTGGVFMLGLGYYLLSMLDADDVSVRLVTSIMLALTIGLILFAARNALRIGRTRTVDDSVAALARRARDADELRLSGWILVLAPLLELAFLGLFLLLPVLIFGVFLWTTRRARESQFLWTLALAVENDMPLDDEVEAFSLTLWSRSRRRYREIAARLREGRSLIDALHLSGVLPYPLVDELRAAQAAGTLPQALRRAASTYTSSLLNSRFDGSIALTAVYAWVVLSVIFVVVMTVMFWIIPSYKEIFADFEMELPALTMRAITLSETALDSFLMLMPLVGLPILAGLIAAVIGTVGWGNLNFPLLMRWFPRWDAPGVLRSLAYAIESQRPLPESLAEMGEYQRRSDLGERLLRMQQETELGQPIWTTLACEGFIRPAEAGALQSAARAGNLSWALRTLADSMQRTGRLRAQVWLEFLKPAAIVAIGCVVGFYVIAFFLPLVKLIGALS